jgi:hypothetical protein
MMCLSAEESVWIRDAQQWQLFALAKTEGFADIIAGGK